MSLFGNSQLSSPELNFFSLLCGIMINEQEGLDLILHATKPTIQGQNVNKAASTVP